jgi:hypothetical protein
VAQVALPALDRASSYHRETFVELVAIDPAMIGGGRGKRAGYLLGAVLEALRHRDGKPNAAGRCEVDADQRAESDD